MIHSVSIFQSAMFMHEVSGIESTLHELLACLRMSTYFRRIAVRPLDQSLKIILRQSFNLTLTPFDARLHPLTALRTITIAPGCYDK